MGIFRREKRRYSQEYVRTASGVAWYDRDQWEKLRKVATDRHLLEESYEEWVTMAERSIRDLEDTGMLIERVPVNVEKLIAWCNERDRPVDSSARAEFAAREFRRHHS